MGPIPQVGETRRLRYTNTQTGKVEFETIKIRQVWPSNQGPKAYGVEDTTGKVWLFAFQHDTKLG